MLAKFAVRAKDDKYRIQVFFEIFFSKGCTIFCIDDTKRWYCPWFHIRSIGGIRLRITIIGKN
jgi:hypothetical protein